MRLNYTDVWMTFDLAGASIPLPVPVPLPVPKLDESNNGNRNGNGNGGCPAAPRAAAKQVFEDSFVDSPGCCVVREWSQA